MMKKIYCIGETVYDIIFNKGEPVAAKAGGSMLNSAVSMGRLGLPVFFISEYANDDIGKGIDIFLHFSNVNTHYVYKYDNGKTSIAIAFLDEKMNASYSFYKHLPSERLMINFPEPESDDIVLFGSFYSINKEVREKIIRFVSIAKDKGAIVIYDPNFRKAHLNELSELFPFIISNMQNSSIIRGSDEDFEMIFGVNNVEDAYLRVSKYCDILIYTMSNKGVFFKTKNREIFVKSANIKPLSTIGAGDNFNAGLIYGIYSCMEKLDSLNNLSDKKIKELLQHGINLATEVCMSYDNYISIEFANNYKNKTNH